jgi:hypothetical protein
LIKGVAVIDFIRLCSEQGIQYRTEGTKHNRPGWVQTYCPFCGHRGKWFLGYHLETGAVNCWHCGKHRLVDVVRLSLQCNKEKALTIIRKYETGRKARKEIQIRVSSNLAPVVLRLPGGCGPMLPRHRKYLAGRKFDPEDVALTWGLLGTGPVGEYRNRIIIPIFLEGKMVSYQGRDITGKSDLKYKACAMENEVVHHKHTLYGIDLVPGDTAVIVEGAADAWRLGPGAVATFGTGFTIPQLNLFCRKFTRAFLLFDPEPSAQDRADRAANLLSARGIDVEVLCTDDELDPGDMPQTEAADLMMELLHK